MFLFGILVLFLAGGAIATGHQGFALKLIHLSFWIFFIATILYIRGIKK